MADNVTFQSSTLATPPDGTIVSADEHVTSGKVQRMKLAMSADGSDTHVQADADGLLVNLGTNNDVTVASLPLPTGAATLAEQQTQTASLSVLDDWDETDRAKVNPIAGQAGVQGGAGASTALTQRVAIATDANAVTVSGVATAANQTTGNTSLSAIETDADAIRIATQLIDDPVQVLGTDTYTEATSKGMTLGAVRRDADTTLVGTTNEFSPLQVDANGRLKVEAFSGETLPVSGTVSVTEPVSVDDNSGSLTVDAPVGTPVNVQIGDAANTATIRNLASNDALNVAIVDGSGAHVTSFGGGTQYLEDDAAPANPTGTMPVLVRDDTPNTQTTTDGDVIAQRGTNYGAAYVQVVSSGGAFIDSFGGSGGTAQADESAFTEGTTNITPIGGVLNDTITSDPTEDQAAAVRITAKRGLHANLRANDGTEIATAGAPLRVDPTGTTTQPMSAASLPLPTGASTSANQTTANTSLAAIEVDADAIRVATQLIDDPVQVLGTDTYTEATSKGMTIGAVRRDADTTLVGTTNEFGPLQMDANGRLKVEAFSGETLPVSGTVTANQGTAGTAWEVVGDVAHDVAAPANPVVVGAQMETAADSAPGTRAGTDGDAVKLASADGAMYVIPGGPQQWKARLTGAMSDTTVKSAPGAGLSLYITTIVYSIGAATASSILLEESTTTAVFGPHYLEAINGRGLVVTLGTPIKIAANTLLSATSTGATTNTLDVYGFTAPG